MKSRRTHQRISNQQDVDVYLYNKSNDSQLTDRVTALLLDMSRQGAGLKFSQVLIDGKHLFYAALDSDTIFLIIVFRSTDNDPEEMTPLVARPIWFDRDMEDSTMPFRMGVQFIAPATPSVLSRLIRA
ncbi:MAG: hypothetical protein PHZ02_08985 [Desulfocapsaceae bacterium]|nr:hypothetical protein [Desulfocapsaceae bacterium]